MGSIFFYKTSNSILFLLLRELWNKYDVETLLRSEISFANVNCGICFGMADGMACAVPAPSSARGVRTAPHGRDALLRVRGTCARGLGFASNRLTRRARRFPARGKRKSPKRFCLLTFDLIGGVEL